MMMPKTISGWCLWLFFLLYGLGAFVSALSSLSFWPWLLGALALIYAIAALFGK